MKTIVLLDTETTGLDPNADSVIEIAIVRYSVPHAAVLDSQSWLVRAASNPAESINRIPVGLLELGISPADAWTIVDEACGGSDAILAHNALFDRQWVPSACEVLNSLPWIDTCNGIKWPKENRCGSSLITLALEHGLGVSDAHRAMTDCLLLARLLTRCAELGHDLQEILKKGMRPTATFQALVPFEQKELARLAGFKWNSTTRQWLRTMAIEDAKELDFAVRQLKEIL